MNNKSDDQIQGDGPASAREVPVRRMVILQYQEVELQLKSHIYSHVDQTQGCQNRVTRGVPCRAWIITCTPPHERMPSSNTVKLFAFALDSLLGGYVPYVPNREG